LNGIEYFSQRLNGFVEFILVKNHFMRDFDNPGMTPQEKKDEWKYILQHFHEPECL
jgi:hypothetical protein